MTIGSDILGRAPILYWPLNDATGPAASDASGNGRPGTYGGTFMLGQYGPEPTTTTVQFGSGGYVSRVGLVQPSTSQFSVVWYASYAHGSTPSEIVLASNGNAGALRGWEVHLTNTDTLSTRFYTQSSTVRNDPATPPPVPIWNRWWHAYALTYNPDRFFTLFVDGVQLFVSGGSFLATGVQSTDTFSFTGGYGGVVAHVAYFDKLLSNADISAIAAYRLDWPFGPLANLTWPSPPSGGGSASLSPSDPVVVDINADLSDIRRSVRRDYPINP